MLKQLNHQNIELPNGNALIAWSVFIEWSNDIHRRNEQTGEKKIRDTKKSHVNTSNTWMLLMLQFDFRHEMLAHRSVIVT